MYNFILNITRRQYIDGSHFTATNRSSAKLDDLYRYYFAASINSRANMVETCQAHAKEQNSMRAGRRDGNRVLLFVRFFSVPLIVNHSLWYKRKREGMNGEEGRREKTGGEKNRKR